MKKRLTKEQKTNVKIHHFVALAIGYNEMAKQSLSLGEKCYHRIMAQNAVGELQKLGSVNGVGFIEPEQVLLTVPCDRMHVNFFPRDIELMRVAVAEYDVKKALEEEKKNEHQGT